MTLDLERLNNRWLAVQIRSGWEIRTAYALRERGYEEFLPLYQKMRRWSDRTKTVQIPLFTGYLFVRFNSQNSYPVLSTPGVIRFVGVGNAPVPVDDSEIGALQITHKAAAHSGPCSFLVVGQQAEIRSGPLRGLTGIVVKLKNRYRLILSVRLLMKSVFVEIDDHDVSPVSSASFGFGDGDGLKPRGFAHQDRTA